MTQDASSIEPEERLDIDTLLALESQWEQALAIQDYASSLGFDWPVIDPVFDKVQEELVELKEEVKAAASPQGANREAVLAEFGDLLFACLNLSRFLELSPQEALRATNRKFVQRFQFIEKQLGAQGKRMQDETLETLDALWELAKQEQADKHEKA